MLSNRIFQISFAVSLFVHALILFQSPGFALFLQQRREHRLVVNYLKIAQEIKEIKNAITPKRETSLKFPPKINADKRASPSLADKTTLFNLGADTRSLERVLNKPAFLKPDMIATKKRITLPAIDINKINNPTYLGYYQAVREKIKRSAYKNYTSTEVGEVYLSFILSATGELKDVRLVEDKSSTSTYLKQVALRSIHDSSPFLAFPRELDYPQLSFNVVISFEIE